MKLLEKDLQQTVQNSNLILKNKNLSYWYQKLYEFFFKELPALNKYQVLEIGSGGSPLKRFYPFILTSDVLPLPGLDYVFDAHQIDKVELLPDESLDLLLLTNVLHHLQSPILFLQAAAKKLKKGGKILLLEPYYSWISYLIYKFLHHEKTDFEIKAPLLEQIDGPLSSSNMALPQMIFFKRKDWENQLRSYYSWDKQDLCYFTGLAYMLSGGLKAQIPIPRFVYRLFFEVDFFLARSFPWLWASFFTLRLEKK